MQSSLDYLFPIKPICNLYTFNNEQVIFKEEIQILFSQSCEETANAQN